MVERRESKNHTEIILFFLKIKGRLPLRLDRGGCHFVFKREGSWFLKKHDAQARSERAHTTGSHVIRKGKLNLIYFNVDSVFWIKKFSVISVHYFGLKSWNFVFLGFVSLF